MKSKNEVIQKRYNRIASLYNLIDKPMDMMAPKSWRKEILAEASGRVLEVGVGTGKNIEFYRNELDLTAIDFSDKMLQQAIKRAEKLGKSPRLMQMDVQNMDFPDNSFDYIFTTFVFCSVPDPVKGLEEIRRVLKPSGQLVMLEHVRSQKRLLGPLMDLLNPLTVTIIGANINRTTVKNLKKAGFKELSVDNRVGDIIKYIKVKKV